jgi:uncharacterized protein YacL
MSDYDHRPGYYPNQQYNPNQPYYQQPQPQQQYSGDAQWPHMKLKDWIITNLLMLIPVANIVLMFMWAFGSNVNPSKKTYFQATLIWFAIGIVFGIILAVVFSAMFYTVFLPFFESLYRYID